MQIAEKWGYIDTTGKIVVQPQFDCAYAFNESGLALVEKDGKIGWIDCTGKFIIEPRYIAVRDVYDKPWDFSFDLAPVGFGSISDCKYGYIDTSGKIVIKPLFNEAIRKGRSLKLCFAVFIGQFWFNC